MSSTLRADQLCCGINWYPNGVTVRQNHRTRLVVKFLSYLGILILIYGLMAGLIIKLNIYDSFNTAQSIGFTVLTLIINPLLVFFPVIPLKTWFRFLLKRKWIFFRERRNERFFLALLLAFERLERFILDGNKLASIEEQACNCIKVVTNNVSKIFDGRCIDFMLTGGAAERYGVPLSSEWVNILGDIKDNHALISDFDFMFHIENICASHESMEGDFMVNLNDSKIGYLQLFVENPIMKQVFNSNTEFLIAKSVKNQIVKAIFATDISVFPGFIKYDGAFCLKGSFKHFVEVKKSGPAIKLRVGNANLVPSMFGSSFLNILEGFISQTNHFFADLTFCIPCKEWPPISNWQSRVDRRWPDTDDVERVINLGCHIVPKSQEGDDEEVTWRYSFSLAEVELSKLINPTARKCFLALKIIGKDHLVFHCSKLSSYHLKTIFLKKLENTGLDFWSEDNIKVAFYALLNDVKHAVDTRTCPHYWLPQINLFEEISEDEMKSLSKILVKIIEHPLPYIEQLSLFNFNIIGLTSPNTNDVVLENDDQQSSSRNVGNHQTANQISTDLEENNTMQRLPLFTQILILINARIRNYTLNNF